jgi:HEPN domain-containing protein
VSVSVPTSAEVRRFYQVALQRFEDAEILFHNDRTTGAIYMAGYAVECMLKALLLAHVPASRRAAVLGSFRGKVGHDLEGLRRALQKRKVSFPASVARRFTSVNTWSTDLRYVPGRKKWQEARAFLDAAAEVLQWVKGRL